MAESAGNLIMITGPSGVGKTTIARQLHQRLGGDWLLWQADLCQPRHHPAPSNLTPEQGLALEQRMFAANIGAITAYLDNDWPVIAELSVMTAAEAEAVHNSGPRHTVIVQLGCSPESLAAHLQERDTPVPMDWVVNFYQQWQDIDLPDALRIDVDDMTPSQVVDQILQNRTSADT